MNPQEQLGQIVQQLAQVAIQRWEAAATMDKCDSQTALLRDSVIALKQQIAQEAAELAKAAANGKQIPAESAVGGG